MTSSGDPSRLLSLIVRRRKLLTWTQADLAEAAGISESSVSLYERKLIYPPLDVFIRICDALAIAPQTLFIQANFSVTGPAIFIAEREAIGRRQIKGPLRRAIEALAVGRDALIVADPRKVQRVIWRIKKQDGTVEFKQRKESGGTRVWRIT